MPKTKEEKKEIISQLEEKTKKQKSMVFTNFKGLKMDDFIQIRGALKEGSAELVVSKKSLLKIALKKSDLDLDVEELTGEVAVIFGYEDVTFPAKTVYGFSKKNPNLAIIGGYLDGALMSSEDVIQLAKIPSREELLGKLVGTIQAPISGLLSVLQGNTRDLLSLLSQIKS